MRLFFLRRKIRGRQTNNSCFSANTEVRPAWSDVESFAAALSPLQNLVSLPVPFWQEPECTFFSFVCVWLKDILCEFKKQLCETWRFKEHYEKHSRVRAP